MTRKSKIVAIGLLAISVASCHKNHAKRHRDLQVYRNNPTYYINDGRGYHQGGISPFWVYWAYRMGQDNRVTSSPGYVYSSRGGGYHSTEFGSHSSISRGSVGRGGFGTSGGHAGA